MVSNRFSACATTRYLLAMGAMGLLTGVPASIRAQDSTPDTAAAAVSLPRYRNQVIGVFDEDTGEPVPAVEVVDLLRGNSTLTTATGTASLIFLPEGITLLRLRKVGYAPETFSVQIGPSDTVPVTATIRRLVMLPRVVSEDSSPHYISPALRGFQERMRHSATGYFLDEKLLRRDEGRPLGNVLERLPSISVLRTGRSMLLLQSPRCSNGGPPDVYLDGVLLSHPPPPPPKSEAQRRRQEQMGAPVQPFDLSDFDVDHYAGVEYYPDDTGIPVEFPHTSRSCGALFLWTREGAGGTLE